MKKLILAFSALSILSLGTLSCKKEKFLQNNLHSNRTSFSDDGLDRIPIINISTSLFDLMRNSEDSDEEKLNYQLYDLAEATRELIQNDQFKQLILDLARESKLGTVYYSEIKEHAPAFYEQINENLEAKNISIESITENMTHQPINPNYEYPETAELEIYEPVIYVPNFEIADNSAKAVISPNIEVLHEDEDYIVIWYYNRDGEIGQTIINESTALSTTNPVFILNHGVLKEKHDNFVQFIIDNEEHFSTTRSGGTGIDLVCNSLKIKQGYRHETGNLNKSEFCVVGSWVDSLGEAAGGAPLFYQFSGGNKDHSYKIKEVTANHVTAGIWQDNLAFIHVIKLKQQWSELVFWNTFERDWNRSWKALGEGIAFEKPWKIWGNMRYHNDWYAFIPSTVPNHALDYWWFINGTEVNFDNWKSSYKLVKED
jgi:hypothetical protein